MQKDIKETFIHPTAIVEDGAEIGVGVSIWHFAHIRRGAVIGEECIIGKGVYLDSGVKLGARSKVQNNVSIYRGVVIEEGAFIGPHVCFTNDYSPRAIDPTGKIKGEADWKITNTLIRRGASIGANSTIVCGVELGEWTLVGAGSVVARSLPPYALSYGNPAKVHGVVSPDGEKVSDRYVAGTYICTTTGLAFEIKEEWCNRV